MFKRFLLTVALLAGFVIFLDPASEALSRFLRLDQPTTYEIQEGDWLSKIALRYYGDVSYWRELELVNRAPNGNRIYPGEKLIVPSFEAIQKIRRARTLSDVNGVVELQEAILAGKLDRKREVISTEPAAESEIAPAEAPAAARKPAAVEPKPAPAHPPQLAQATPFYLSTPFVTAAVVLAVLAVIGLVLYSRKKKSEEEVTFYGNTTEEKEEDTKNIFIFEDAADEDAGNGRRKQGKETALAE